MIIGMKEVIHESPMSRGRNLNAEAAVAGVRKDAEASFPSRRREMRVGEQKVCSYSRCESFDGEQVTIEQGEGYCINRSEHGILVMIGERPQQRQLLELHVAETRWEYSMSLYEVQWTKMLPIESNGELFLVGCRLIFGASRYGPF
ncbi:MAG: hypothetical protein P0121_07315 [Nitrospira sp.]|nr:hypothetical protein [Nitrospira sp.]